MSMWREQLIAEAQRLAFRFYRNKPDNEAERIIFDALRKFIAWLSVILAEFSGKFSERKTA